MKTKRCSACGRIDLSDVPPDELDQEILDLFAELRHHLRTAQDDCCCPNGCNCQEETARLDPVVKGKDIAKGDYVTCHGKGLVIFEVTYVGKDHAVLEEAWRPSPLRIVVRLHKLDRVRPRPPKAFKVVDRVGNLVDWFEDLSSAEAYAGYWNLWGTSQRRLRVVKGE